MTTTSDFGEARVARRAQVRRHTGQRAVVVSGASEDPVIQVEDLSVSYGGKVAVADASLDFGLHEITAMIGPSGCVKSTVLRCLNRMNDLIVGAEVSGKITYHSQDMYAADVDVIELRRRIGMVFQKPNPFPKSIYENVAFGPRVKGRKAAIRRVGGRGLAWATFGTGHIRAHVRGVPEDAALEWGSITKTVTGTLLALMVADGTLQLRTPLTDLLPGARPLPLEALASHTAGLPRLLPGSLRFSASVWRDRRDPYAAITEQRLLADLRRTRLRRCRYRYSNAGAGLLGLALARPAGTSYDTLVQQRICAPLGLSSVTTADRAELIDGSDRRGRVVPHWHFTDAMAGAGALRGTLRDLARWAQAVGGGAPEPLATALQEARRPRVGMRVAEVGLGWHRSTLGGVAGLRAPRTGQAGLLWHNGGTGGFRSFVRWDEATARGVAVLSA